MMAPRRFLPSVSSLIVREAMDRLGTTLVASEELSLTHSAVSRLLAVLEQKGGPSHPESKFGSLFGDYIPDKAVA